MSAKHHWFDRVQQNLSLRLVLIVPFVIELSLAVGLVGYLSFKNGQKAVNTLAYQSIEKVSEIVENHLKSYLSTPFQINQMNQQAIALGFLNLNDLPKAGQYFGKQLQVYDVGYIGYALTTGEYAGAGRWMQGEGIIIDEVSARTKWKDYAYATDANGNRTKIVEITEYQPKEEAWYTETVKAGKSVWSPVYAWEDFPDIISVSANTPIYDNNKQLVGVISVDLLLSNISNFLRKLKVSPSAKIAIIERNGWTIASSGSEAPFHLVDGEAKRMKIIDSQNLLIRAATRFIEQKFNGFDGIDRTRSLEFEFQDARQFIQVTPWKDEFGLDWLVVIVVPESDFMSEIERNKQITILLCLLAVGGAIVLGILTAAWIGHPIFQLIRSSHAIANGYFNQQIRVSGIRELRSLSESFNQMNQQLLSFFEELEARVEVRTADLAREKDKSEQLLLNILPKEIADRLKQEQGVIAEQFEEVTILFADLVGFTRLADRLPPRELVECLNHIFSIFDRLVDLHGLEKIKTIGDAYMVVGGLPTPNPDCAEAIANMALDMQVAIKALQMTSNEAIEIRIGINTGAVVAGVIGIKKFIYDLWGDAVNVASRMESLGVPGQIQVTSQTYDRLKDKYSFQPRGKILVKGKGEMMTYWLIGKQELANSTRSDVIDNW
jgi:class 3 adenylate cyclase/HAMP domain-containing protein